MPDADSPARTDRAAQNPNPQNEAAQTISQAARQKAANRFAVLNAFIDLTMGKLTPSEVTTWIVLYRDTKPDGLARTGQADLARRAGITDRQVRRAIANLKSRGLLRIARRGGTRCGPSSYRVLPRPQ